MRGIRVPAFHLLGAIAKRIAPAIHDLVEYATLFHPSAPLQWTYLMTVAIARKFGERIIVISDTMTFNETSAPQNNIIPGQLKSIVINKALSVTYSGSVPRCLDAIRNAKILFDDKHCLEGVIALLRDVAVQNYSTEFGCEFMVTSHLPSARMCKIWKDGIVTEKLDQLWIGNQEVVNVINDREEAISADGYEHVTGNEMRFRNAVAALWFQPAARSHIGVGGFFITQLSSPLGHTYNSEGGVAWHDTTQFPPGVTPAQARDRKSGMTQYNYSIVAPTPRGVAVVGAYLPDAELGFIYCPLRDGTPGPTCHPQVTLDELSRQVDQLALQLGGQLVDEGQGLVP
jgi:hypothetical protein